MTIHRRTGLILAGIAGTLLMVFVFVVPVLLNGDRYRPEAISYLEQSTGKKLEIGRLAVTFFPKLTIHVDDFAVKSPSDVARSDVVLTGRRGVGKSSNVYRP